MSPLGWKYPILLLLSFLLISSCRSFTEQGELLTQALEEQKQDHYLQALQLTLEALKLDPQYKRAEDLLKDLFLQGTAFYLNQIDALTGPGDRALYGREAIEGLSDKVFFYYQTLETMHRLPEAAGRAEIDGLEPAQFSRQMDQWGERAADEHLREALDLMETGHALEARKAHKHLLYIEENYPQYSKDTTRLKEQALEAAQITLAPVLAKNSSSAPWLDSAGILTELEQSIIQNRQIEQYAELVDCPDLQRQIFEQDSPDQKQWSEQAALLGIDYLIWLEMDTRSSLFKIEETRDDRYRRDPLETLSTRGDPLIISSRTRITEVNRTMKAQVKGYGQLLETHSAAFYGEKYPGELSQEKNLHYQEISPATVNVLQETGEDGVTSLLSMAKRDFLTRKTQDFHYLDLSESLYYYEDNGSKGWKTELEPEDLLLRFLNTGLTQYQLYKNENLKSFAGETQEREIMARLWLNLARKIGTDLEEILE